MLNRRSTLPALLDVNSEALMLSRQLHLDFHEVKCVVAWPGRREDLGLVSP